MRNGEVAQSHRSAPEPAQSKLNGSAATVARWFSLGLSGVYVVAFASLWCQVPGLFGVDGLLPGGSGYFRMPWLLRQFRDPAVGMEWMCCAGTTLGALGVACARFRCGSCLAVLWWLYRILYRAGGDFLGFQWDILLLECGLLGVLSQPLFPLALSSDNIATTRTDSSLAGKPVASVNARAHMGLWPLQWLLFRLMFASGAVKLLWGDMHWWSLTALAAHFQSTCIPTPLSAIVHRLPLALLKAMTSLAFIIEMPAAFLCILPSVGLPTLAAAKHAGFFLQVCFQVAIQMTGNYGFFNALTVVLCLPMLADTNLRAERKCCKERLAKLELQHPANTCSECDCNDRDHSTRSYPAGIAGSNHTPFSWVRAAGCSSPLTTAAVVGSTIVAAFYCFGISLQQPRFSPVQFRRFTNNAACLSVVIAVLSGLRPLWLCALSIFSEMQTAIQIIKRSRCAELKATICRLGGSIFSIAHTFTVTVCAGLLFGGSIPEFFAGLDIPLHRIGPIWRVFGRVTSFLRSIDGVASYGLFRSMTGVHGREELVIEAAIDRVAAAAGNSGAWFEIPFRFKPGGLSTRPPWNSPHQPRLDWQVGIFQPTVRSRRVHMCYACGCSYLAYCDCSHLA